MARDLKLEISLQDAFVPGVRRGFVLILLKPRADETEEEMRQRAQACIRRVSQAGVDLGAKPDGNRSKLWLAVSQPPEKRRRDLATVARALRIQSGRHLGPAPRGLALRRLFAAGTGVFPLEFHHMEGRFKGGGPLPALV